MWLHENRVILYNVAPNMEPHCSNKSASGDAAPPPPQQKMMSKVSKVSSVSLSSDVYNRGGGHFIPYHWLGFPPNIPLPYKDLFTTSKHQLHLITHHATILQATSIIEIYMAITGSINSHLTSIYISLSLEYQSKLPPQYHSPIYSLNNRHMGPTMQHGQVMAITVPDVNTKALKFSSVCWPTWSHISPRQCRPTPVLTIGLP